MSGSAARQLLLLPASNGFEIQFRKPLVIRLTVPRKKGFGAPLLNTAARRSVVPLLQSNPSFCNFTWCKLRSTPPLRSRFAVLVLTRAAMAADEGVKLFSGSKRRASTSTQVHSAKKRQHELPATQSEEPFPDGTAPSAQQNGQALEEIAANVQAETPASFKALGLSDWLDRLCKSLGMTQPTEVQKGCIPSILKGRDVIGTAHTGSGKTAAFALPILQRLAQDPYGVYALVLTPTRYLPSA